MKMQTDQSKIFCVFGIVEKCIASDTLHTDTTQTLHLRGIMHHKQCLLVVMCHRVKAGNILDLDQHLKQITANLHVSLNSKSIHHLTVHAVLV